MMKKQQIKNKSFSQFEIDLMQDLLKEAEARKGLTYPNPMVGAAIVKNGKIISKGWHEKAGEAHAEVNAINATYENLKNATMYITLEPCTHWGKTPPCVQKIIEAGLKKVVWAVDDVNPQIVKNRAKVILENAGVLVETGLLEDKAKKVNEVFFKNQLTRLPFVTLKIGMSINAKITLSNNKNKYITSEKSLRKVHILRREYEAICVGINTILKDNPQLDVRFGLLENGKYKNPIIIILDTFLRTPINAKIFDHNDSRVIIFCKKGVKKNQKYMQLLKKFEIIEISENKDGLSWKELLNFLYKKKNITSVLVEGGQRISTSLLKSKMVDKIHFFVAPKIILEKKAISAFWDNELENLDINFKLKDVESYFNGEDIEIIGFFDRKFI